MATDTQSEAKKKPLETLQVGNVKAWFWKNETQDGSRTFVNLTFTRERDGDHYTSFGKRDLQSLARAAQLAETCFDEITQRAANTSEPDDEPSEPSPF